MEAALQQAKETLEIRVLDRTAQLNRAVEQRDREIEGRQQAQEALHKEREFLNALLDNLADGIVACDANGILTLFNRATREFHGIQERSLPPEEWATYYNLYQPDGKTPLHQEEVPLFRALRGETVRNTEMVIAPKAGKSRTILASGQAIVDATGKKMGAVIALQDITERKEAEAAVQVSELRLNSILHSLQDIVWSVVFESGGTQKVAFINPAAEKIYGRPCQEFLENPYLWQEVIHPEDRDRCQESSQEILQENRSEMEYRIVRPSTEVRWVQTRAWLIRDAAGAIIRMDGITSDITDRKIAEKTQARLTAIIEAATDFVGTSDALGNVLYLNRAGRQMVGLGEDAEVTGMAIADLMPEAFIDRLLNQAVPTALREGAWSGESALLHRDGRENPLHKEWSKEWYDREILGKVETVEVEAEKPPKTIGELVADFKAHFDATHQPGERSERNWTNSYLQPLKKFPDWSKPLSQNELKLAIEATESNTRARFDVIWMMSKFTSFVGEGGTYKAFLSLYKDSTAFDVKERNIPGDGYIEGVFGSLEPLKSCRKDLKDSILSTQWSFGILATYGLRCHETINILNLFEPSIYKGETIHPYNDRVNNPQAIIHIGGSTKTGERLAMPLSPLGKDWLTQFDLLNPKPPETSRPPTAKEEDNQHSRISKSLQRRNKQTDTHAYRHAYNHRSREQGVDVAVAAKSKKSS